MGKRVSLYRSIGEYKLFCKHSPSALNDHTADDSYSYALQRTLLTSESCPIICMGRFCRYGRKIKAASGSGCCSFYVVKRCRTSFSIVCGGITSARGRRKKFFCAPCFYGFNVPVVNDTTKLYIIEVLPRDLRLFCCKSLSFHKNYAILKYAIIKLPYNRLRRHRCTLYFLLYGNYSAIN